MGHKTMETLHQELTAKVAGMSYEDRFARLQQRSDTELNDETELEFAKLLFGANATVKPRHTGAQ